MRAPSAGAPSSVSSRALVKWLAQPALGTNKYASPPGRSERKMFFNARSMRGTCSSEQLATHVAKKLSGSVTCVLVKYRSTFFLPLDGTVS